MLAPACCVNATAEIFPVRQREIAMEKHSA
jgi:hypothetical protein